MNEWDEIANSRLKQLISGRDVTYTEVILPSIEKYINYGGKIIDVGCGTGFGTAFFARYDPEIIGLDPSLGSIEVAQRAYKGICFVHSTVHEFEVRDKFDIVILNMVLHNATDPIELLAGCKKLLRSGGRLIYTMCHPKYWVPYKTALDPEDFEYSKEGLYSFPFTTTLNKRSIGVTSYYHRRIETYQEIFEGVGLVERVFREIFPNEKVMRLYPRRWEYPRYVVGVLSVQ
jgi:ubiquinone/menaquinone biosynthesis C-methylase UbiE